MIVKDIDEVFAEVEETFGKLKLLNEEPKIGRNDPCPCRKW